MMRDIYTKLKYLSINSIVILGIASCTSPTYLDARDNIQEVFEQTQDLLKPAHVVVTDEAYIDSKPIYKAKHPEWMERRLDIKISDETTLKQLMSKLFEGSSKIKVMYQGELAQEGVDAPLMPTKLRGQLKDVINKISKMINYHYIIDGYDLVWAKYETKIFQLGIPPGEASYKMGDRDFSSSYDINAQASVGSEQKAGYIVYESGDDSNIWNTLQDVVDKLKSNEGEAHINRDSSTLTITDRPSNVKAVAKYVEDFNKFNMQQVGIKIQVLEVELDEEHKRGIDWNVLRETIRSKLNFDFNLGDAPNTLGSLTGTVGGNLIWNILDPQAGSVDNLENRSKNSYAGSNLTLIQYIEQQGNVSIISEPRFTVLNNQAAEIKIVRDEGYVHKRSNTITQNSSQVSIEPGSIKTGFTLYIIPTIFDGKVLLQITTSLSRKLALTTFSESSTDNANNTTETSSIQLPTISDRRFTQRSVVPNNATLVLTGFKENSHGIGDISPFKMKFAGGQSAVNKTTEIVILVTPVIISA